MALEIGSRLGPYEILAQLGQGGMGEVYRATDTKLARTVALKVLAPALTGDAEYMARFTREAHILASFNHPNIAVIYGLEESGGNRALVMELVEGRNLADCIAAGSLGMEETLLIARQIAEALEAAHEKGVVHRDLKPANIMLTPEGVVKVLDFGLAKQAETRASSGDHALSLTVRATQAGVVMGTAGYMAPEQAAAKPADRRADIWAFGVVLWEMLCRKPLFSGETIAHTLADVLRAEIDLNQLPADTPAPIRDLIARCLERDVKKRLQAIGEARIAIERHLANPAPAPAAVTVPPPVAAKPSRLPWAVTAVAVVAALAIGAMHWREAAPEKPVMRFTVPAPDKTLLHSFALSPDGRHIVMAVDQAGKGKLWVRSLDSLSPYELSGTEGAIYPFWSPDSKTVGFFASGKMKKIAIGGGPALVLCDAPQGRGGAWNEKGDIVFAPGNDGPLHRVSSAGGVSTKLTHPGKGIIHRFPAFLPDGKRFLFLESLGPAGTEGVYVGSLDGTKPWRLLPEPSSALYMPPQSRGANAHILFAQQRTLMAQPVDPASLQSAGELFPVAEQIAIANRNYAQMSVSPSGTAAYWTGSGGLDSQLTWLNKEGKVLGTVGAPGAISGASLSPDGRTAAVSRPTTQLGAEIWLMDLERGVDTKLTFKPTTNGYPIWTRDGRHVLFMDGTDGIGIIPVNGQGGVRLLLKGQGSLAAPSDVSPDGKLLLYVEGTVNSSLWVKPLEGDGKPYPYLEASFHQTAGQFSPDGKWVAYASNESGAFEVYVRPFPSGPGKWKVSPGGGNSPRWSPDGKELYYVAPDDTVTAAAVSARDGQFNVSRIQPLFPLQARNTNVGGNLPAGAIRVAPDGKRFLVNRRLRDAESNPLTVVVNWLGAVKK
ncbi:MAG: protein kinase [Bryobacteraceae bacterium]